MKQKYIPNIGLVNFVKRRRGKYVNISIQPSTPVRVSLPYYVSYQYAEDVLLEKLNWVRSKIQKVQVVEEKLTKFYFDTNFETKYHRLLIKTGRFKNLKYIIADGVTIVLIPKENSIGDDNVQQFVRDAITETYRIEAKQILPNRVRDFAKEYDISINKIFIKNMKSQWGSCSKRQNINLNLHLMRLPNELIDYVIMHELTHISQMNHSKKFWNLLEKRFPNSKYYDKKIKEFSINYW